jgi:hypothetical protein
VAALPEPKWKEKPNYVIFSVGGFAPELKKLANTPSERLHLVSGKDLFPPRK